MPMLELIAAPAVCVPYAQAQQELTDKFGEAPFGAGVTPDGRLVLGTLNAETGTWTLLVIEPSGQACAIVSGSHWEMRATQPGKPT